MAFRTVVPDYAAERAKDAAGHAVALRKHHVAAAADLLKLAESPADANTALAAVKKWRADQERRALYWRFAAMLQIASGDRPDDVCAELGIGRTALQHAVRAEGTELAIFQKFLRSPRPKTKKVA
ncbi:Uncharacterised protein [Mycobacteroides abscessus subsp. abscessus]|uniref:hypothetical protein n=1 Tax=Mycobacteroides abscessus TaxID=36809 RepID=UPI0009A8CEFC|nr:hypothetical protein [Mycobacteroides abscessus]SKM36114.1 Uncharacterised protein [Mycobacteroides abscessus subsp. abscessus]